MNSKSSRNHPSGNAHQKPNGNKPAFPTKEKQQPPKLSCAEILKNNVREAILRDFELHWQQWDILANAPVTDPAAMQGGEFKDMWLTVPLQVRFCMSFNPKQGLDHAATAIEDYEPVVRITGSKLVPLPKAHPQGENQEM